MCSVLPDSDPPVTDKDDGHRAALHDAGAIDLLRRRLLADDRLIARLDELATLHEHAHELAGRYRHDFASGQGKSDENLAAIDGATNGAKARLLELSDQTVRALAPFIDEDDLRHLLDCYRGLDALHGSAGSRLRLFQSVTSCPDPEPREPRQRLRGPDDVTIELVAEALLQRLDGLALVEADELAELHVARKDGRKRAPGTARKARQRLRRRLAA